MPVYSEGLAQPVVVSPKATGGLELGVLNTPTHTLNPNTTVFTKPEPAP